MADKIPSYDESQQLESLRPGTGLTDDVADPAAAPDEVNSGAWKLYDEQSDYASKFPAPGKKGA
jgi:hypothetical protein